MKQRWWILIAAAVIAAGWFMFGRSREPMHDGKPVSYWFKEYYFRRHGGNPQHTGDEISHAMATLGTNALPYLVREALSTRQDSSWRSNYYALLEKLPESWHVPTFISLDELRDAAVMAISGTGPPPELLLPLVREGLDSPNPLLHRQGLKILDAIVDGDEDRKRLLAPYFIPALRLADRESRQLAIEFLNGIGAPARPAIPDLIPLLGDQHGEDALYLATAATLGSLGADARPAIPKLQAVFNQESNLWARVDLAVALLRIDASQSAAMDFLLQELKDLTSSGPASGTYASIATGYPLFVVDLGIMNSPQSVPRSVTSDFPSRPWSVVAADRLGLIGSNAQAAIPALVEAMRGTNVAIMVTAAKALRLIGTRKELFLPVLAERLKSEDELTRLAAALEILKSEPADSGAQGVLVDLIKNHSRYAMLAIYGLSQMDPSAKEAIPVLQQALRSDDQHIRDAATAALEIIKHRDHRPR